MPKKAPDNIPEYSRRLRLLLETRKTNFQELSKLLYVSANYLSLIACGKRKLSPEIAKRIAEIFPGIRPQWLLCLDDYMTEEDRTKEVLDLHRTIEDLTEELIQCHGYSIAVFRTATETYFHITSPTGKDKVIPAIQYNNLIKSINDYLEGQLLLGFRDIQDSAREYSGGVF